MMWLRRNTPKFCRACQTIAKGSLKRPNRPPLAKVADPRNTPARRNGKQHTVREWQPEISDRTDAKNPKHRSSTLPCLGFFCVGWRGETWKSCYETSVWRVMKPCYETHKNCCKTIYWSFVTGFRNVTIAWIFLFSKQLNTTYSNQPHQRLASGEYLGVQYATRWSA